MHRLACVDVPALPLQLLLRSHPDWIQLPVVVVDQDKPAGTILWVNEQARRYRILRGMRYDQALALASELRASTVSSTQISEGVELLLKHLQKYSPGVEPCPDEPGVFWLNASGLNELYPSLNIWSQSVVSHLQHHGLFASVVVGFNRFSTYAVARADSQTLVFKDPQAEQQVALCVPLERLVIAPGTRDLLRQLGVRTVGHLIKLPAEGILKRFGPDVHRLHRLASGDLKQPLQPVRLYPPIRSRLILDFGVSNAQRLLFLIKRQMPQMLEQLAERTQALALLRIKLIQEDGGVWEQPVQPAVPSLNEGQIVDLARLTLERLSLTSPVLEIRLEATGLSASTGQLELFAHKPRRDIEAANRALARVRAELGEEAVLRAELRKGHLPEATYAWVPLTEILVPHPTKKPQRQLVRRIYDRPRALPARPRRNRDNGWLISGPEMGPVVRIDGPYVLSGGWWNRTAEAASSLSSSVVNVETHRRYHFAETGRGDLLWVFHDRRRRRWFCQGRVE